MEVTMIDFLMNPASPSCRTVVGNRTKPGKGQFQLCDCDLHDPVSCRSSKIPYDTSTWGVIANAKCMHQKYRYGASKKVPCHGVPEEVAKLET